MGGSPRRLMLEAHELGTHPGRRAVELGQNCGALPIESNGADEHAPEEAEDQQIRAERACAPDLARTHDRLAAMRRTCFARSVSPSFSNRSAIPRIVSRDRSAWARCAACR